MNSQWLIFLLDFFAQYDVVGDVDEYKNVLFNIPGTGTPLFMNAHLDTVEPTGGIVLKRKKKV